MKDTKLINMLKSLTQEEMASFEKFIASPYFNSVKNHIKLLDELKKFYPDFTEIKLTNEYIYKKLFKGKSFNKQVMWNLSSGFEKLVREFLVQNALKKSKPHKYMLVFNELENRGLEKSYLKEMDEMENIMNKDKIDREYFYYLWVLEEARISYWQKVKGLQNAFAGNLFKSAELSTLEFLMKLYEKIADISFYEEKFNIVAEDNVFNEIVKNINFKKIVEECAKSSSKNARLIEFFCNVILCYTDSENEDHFTKVRDFLFKNHTLFETDEKRNLVSILENYCLNRRIEKNFNRKQLFELHKFRLKENILTYENGKFNKMLYNQIISNGLALDKIQWVTNFINEYTPKLVPEQQKSMKALAEGLVNYKLEKYDKVLKNLNDVVFVDTRDKVHVKNLTARTYYDMGEYNILLSHIDSSKHFLKNNKELSVFYRESYKNFYSYLHKFVIAIEKNDKEALKLLIEKIKKENTLIHKRWLIDRAEKYN